MEMAIQLPASFSRTIQTKLVLPPDTNHMGTIFIRDKHSHDYSNSNDGCR